jgi:hypothetical protein
MPNKIKGTNEGSKVETLIENYLNNKIIEDLKDSKLKKFILYICKDNRIEIKKGTTIKVKKFKRENFQIKGSPKTDRVLFVNNKKFRISIKSGYGGAFHQEPEVTFIDFLKDNTDINKEIIIFLKSFLRSNKIEIRNSIVSKFFKKNKSILISRAFAGRFNEPEVDYYYFCPKVEKNDSIETKIKKIEKGKYINKSLLLKYVASQDSNGACPVGRLTFQAYGRKRGTDIQFKWGTCYNDIK